MSATPHIAILGGGPAGLAAAHYARRGGATFELYEATGSVGGNARTIRFGDVLVDTGAHRLHDRDPETTALARELLGADLLTVDAPSQLLYAGRLIDFPLAPLDLLRKLPLRTIAAIASENIALRLRTRAVDTPQSFGATARATYGGTLASIALLGYSRKLWGRDPDALLPEVAGSRLAKLDLATFLVESFGGRRSARRHLDGAFLYPRLGIGQLFDRLASTLGEGVHLDAPVTRIEHADGRVTAIDVAGQRQASASHVVDTLPLGLSARLLDPAPPASVLEAAAAIRYRHIRLGVLVIRRERLSPNASIYFPDADVPFTRLYESKNRSAQMAPRGVTALVLEVPCEPGEESLAIDADEFHRRNLDALGRHFGLRPQEVLERHELVIPNAYPILEIAARPHIERLLGYFARFSNMRLAGRNARMRYASIHDMFADARSAIASLLADPD